MPKCPVCIFQPSRLPDVEPFVVQQKAKAEAAAAAAAAREAAETDHSPPPLPQPTPSTSRVSSSSSSRVWGEAAGSCRHPWDALSRHAFQSYCFTPTCL